MFTFNHLSFSYGNKAPKLFNDFNMTLEAGNVYGLLGKNGAGKSTLIYLMTGLLTPESGEVLMEGDNVRRRLPKTVSEIFLVPEEFDLPRLTMRKYISINAPFYPRFSMEDMERYLEIFEMSGHMDDKLTSLSMGQKKKVFMSFAFATNTRALIMDEPTNGLDIPSKSQFRKLITTGMSDDKMILISTHQVRDISDILDHIAIIDHSQVMLNTSMANVMGRLAFRPLREGDQPIFVLQSPYGPLGAVPTTEGEETNVDLEMLFNATLQNPEAINRLFTASK